ncbi:MAG: hypothetical protein JSW54_00555 [Fidelibacterota bacterium]|nr:MAG: hypothetical protein JSW54_00555 [Candidatus Neomarinimicrobiota bacterium]
MTAKVPARLKAVVVVAIQIMVALLHLVTGDQYRGPFPDFVNGYLIDILLPFALYFLLSVKEYNILRHWFVKAGLVFAVGVTVEIAQYYGAPVLGETYDPLDIVMYGTGVLTAALFDRQILPRTFKFWRVAHT